MHDSVDCIGYLSNPNSIMKAITNPHIPGWLSRLDWLIALTLLILGVEFLRSHLVGAGIALYQFFIQGKSLKQL
jgi:hypothetical protein